MASRPPLAGLQYGDRQDIRSQLIAKHGETTVLWAELAVVIQLLFAQGVIKPTEFADLVSRQLGRIEERRRQAAGLPD